MPQPISIPDRLVFSTITISGQYAGHGRLWDDYLQAPSLVRAKNDLLDQFEGFVGDKVPPMYGEAHAKGKGWSAKESDNLPLHCRLHFEENDTSEKARLECNWSHCVIGAFSVSFAREQCVCEGGL